MSSDLLGLGGLSTDPLLSNVNKGIGAQFDRFLRKIQLTSTQKEAAISRHTAMRKKLETEFPGSRTFIVGSYAKNTSIRPPSDLDIFLVLPQSFWDNYNSFPRLFRNTQSELLQDVKTKIQKHYPSTTIKADGQVIVVSFNTSFSVEIVPAFEQIFSGRFKICDTSGGGSWKEVDPVGEGSTLTLSNTRTNGNTVRLIKMVKCWKRVCNVPLKSFHLEILVQDFLANYEYRDKSSVYYDWMIRDFFDFLVKKGKSFYLSISHPTTCESMHLGTAWVSKAEMALLRARKAIENGEKYSFLARAEWRKIFGNWFTG